MTAVVQPDLGAAPAHSGPTLAEAQRAGVVAMERVASHEDQAWMEAAERHALSYPPGHRFLAEDLLVELEEMGQIPSNRKAIGAVVRRLAAKRKIRRTPDSRPARTSHGSPRPVWVRLPDTATHEDVPSWVGGTPCTSRRVRPAPTIRSQGTATRGT